MYLIHFSLKKRLLIIIILAIILFISFYFGFVSQNFSQDSNIYIFNTSDVGFKNIHLLNNYKRSTILNNKIAPGTTGDFNLIIENTSKETMQYSFMFKENNSKPRRIIF